MTTATTVVRTVLVVEACVLPGVLALQLTTEEAAFVFTVIVSLIAGVVWLIRLEGRHNTLEKQVDIKFDSMEHARTEFKQDIERRLASIESTLEDIRYVLPGRLEATVEDAVKEAVKELSMLIRKGA